MIRGRRCSWGVPILYSLPSCEELAVDEQQIGGLWGLCGHLSLLAEAPGATVSA